MLAETVQTLELQRLPTVHADVIVWQGQLDPLPGRLELAERVLTPLERALAGRIVRKPALERRILSLALTRICLAQHLHLLPADVVLLREDQRPPRLLHPNPPQFSISHAGNLLLVALSAQRPIGVDVEPLRERRHLAGLAQIVLAPTELAMWQSLDKSAQLQAFYRLWTAKEALTKAHGLTLADGLQRRLVVLQPDGQVQAANPHEILLPLQVDPGHCATLALLEPS